MKTCPYCGKEYPDDIAVCTADQTRLIAETSKDAHPVPPPLSVKLTAACPTCGASDYKPALEFRSSFSLPVFLTGGLLAVFFHNASHARRLQCNRCGTLFSISTRASRFFRFIFWLSVTPAIIC